MDHGRTSYFVGRSWQRKLFLALCRRYGLTPYREPSSAGARSRRRAGDYRSPCDVAARRAVHSPIARPLFLTVDRRCCGVAKELRSDVGPRSPVKCVCDYVLSLRSVACPCNSTTLGKTKYQFVARYQPLGDAMATPRNRQYHRESVIVRANRRTHVSARAAAAAAYHLLRFARQSCVRYRAKKSAPIVSEAAQRHRYGRHRRGWNSYRGGSYQAKANLAGRRSSY